MKKDTFYFSHDSNAMDDPKIVKLIDSLGMEGYGIFWGLIEVLRNQPDNIYPIESAALKYRQWNTSTDKIKAVISGYGLFEIDSEEFFSLSLNRRLELVDKKRLQKIDAGRKGGLQRALNQGNTSGAKVLLKRNVAKESKVKENKVNKSKDNNGLYATFLEKFNQVTERNFRVLDNKTKHQLNARLKEGYTMAEILTATANCSQDDFHMENTKYLTPEFITRADKLQKYLNAKPSKKNDSGRRIKEDITNFKF